MNEVKKIEGFDSAIISVSKTHIAYSIVKCIEILSKGMDYDEALEYFYFNIKPNYNTKHIKWK